MDEPISTPRAPQTAAEYEAAIEQLLAEMRRLNEQMRRDQAEIDRLKAESKLIRARTDEKLAQIQVCLDAMQA